MDLNLAFYTCFYGSVNNTAFKIPEVPSLKYKCYYYTNNASMFQQLKSTNWIGRFDNIPTKDDLIESAMASKHVKACPDKFIDLKGYSYLCYFDSKLEIDVNLIENLILDYFIRDSYALLLPEHWFIRHDVWNEFNEAMLQPRYKLEAEKYKTYITKQLSNGLSQTTRHHCCTGILIRNMKHPKINDLNSTWYQHIQECGIECQISFFFVKQLFSDCVYSLKETNELLYSLLGYH